MTSENKPKENVHQIKISTTHNEKLESLISYIEKERPFSRVNKQKLIECAIEKLSESDALEVAKQYIDKRALILDQLKNDKHLSDTTALIELLKKQ